MKKLILAILVIFSLNSCNQNDPQILIRDRVVTKPVPRLKILNKVEFYEIQDYKSYNSIYWLINKVEFDMASDRIKRKEHKIKFYEKQNIKFNLEFANGGK